MNIRKLFTVIALLIMTIPGKAQLTINIRYSGEKGAARAYVKEMEESGIAARIRAVEGCIRYDYFFPADDPEGLLLIDEWADAAALDRYHASPMMQEAAALREKYGLGGRKVTMFHPAGGATWPKGEPNDAYAQYFTGQSYLNLASRRIRQCQLRARLPQQLAHPPRCRPGADLRDGLRLVSGMGQAGRSAYARDHHRDSRRRQALARCRSRQLDAAPGPPQGRTARLLQRVAGTRIRRTVQQRKHQRP